jgi:hypothetical protein
VFADLQLVWNNCKTYNQSGSDIYVLAENMERRCKKLVKELKKELKLDNNIETVPAPAEENSSKPKETGHLSLKKSSSL